MKVKNPRFTFQDIALLFRLDSDVDMAVEGLKADDYWTAWREVEQIIKGKSIDFIDIECAKESVKESIQCYGVEI